MRGRRWAAYFLNLLFNTGAIFSGTNQTLKSPPLFRPLISLVATSGIRFDKTALSLGSSVPIDLLYRITESLAQI
jgi:hypothetical protein